MAEEEHRADLRVRRRAGNHRQLLADQLQYVHHVPRDEHGVVCGHGTPVLGIEGRVLDGNLCLIRGPFQLAVHIPAAMGEEGLQLELNGQINFLGGGLW